MNLSLTRWLSSLLAGGDYDPSVSEVDDAVKHLLSASRQIGEVEWALRELGKLTEQQCAAELWGKLGDGMRKAA